MNKVFVQGIPSGISDSNLRKFIADLFLISTDNLSWLQEGDTVLLKPALNSGDPYPATSHPLTIHTVAEVLKERGARVIIGDQSGIEHVLHHPGGVIRGRTRENYVHSKMGSADDIRFVSFEEGDWDRDFIHYRSNNTDSWQNGFYITSLIDKVDHIISLPRVSTHAQAGVTLGLKIMVGLLRQDSRLEFHANGPFNNFIVNYSQGSNIPSIDDGSGTFFEKIVEISDAIKAKLRLTLYTATKVQVTFGPDECSIRRGNWGLGRSYIRAPDPGLIFGSSDIVAAEAFALSLLMDLKRSSPFHRRWYERIMLFQNKNIQDLYSLQIADHPFIRHSIKIGLGQMPGEIIYQDVPVDVQDRMNAYLL